MAKRFIGAQQTTVFSPIMLQGKGVHSGGAASIVLLPAEADTGVVFRKAGTDVPSTDITADFRAVTNVTLCTVLGDGNGGVVATVEHLLAALRGLCVDNVIVEIDSEEVPIMDGSSSAFVDAIDAIGIRELDEPRKFIKVLKTIRVEDGSCWGELTQHSGFHVDVEIDFDTPAIGRQRRAFEMSPGVFRAELSRARTFGFMKDVEALWAAGRALGSSLDNTVAIGDDKVVNPEGLRYSDEFVRHKMLDAIGDLALAGRPMLCADRSSRGGHHLNTKMLNALFADADAWTLVEAPSVRQVGRASMQMGTAAVNYAADRT
ncbi:MAG: UDP-3-O-acyl-N-acetylglucosamine deacetylase [Hyphomicrobiaceae bacterium]